ncbi:uncharacterized protein LOC135072830 [Ostrinia nubilalis]|uniref:uncharacterized protein LOC135072830 n=1 Tax=Ostrinia nubilalis TaxID=29057 RepID=UPI0030823C3F
MGNESVVDQIVNNLSFEVEAVPQDDDKLASTSNTTPLNVKIRVRKKNESGIQHGVLSVPKFGRPDAQPERIRLISSDQTIMSFNMSMEADLVKKPKRKPRKSLFARCLGTQYDDDEMPYAPSTAYNAKVSDANTTSKSDGVIRQNFTLSKTNYDNAVDLQIHTKKHGILGKCKPGGCLDPPFGEEKYSYEPTQKIQLKKMPGITEDKVEKPKKIKVSKMVADQRNINVSNELSKESIGNKTKTKSQDESDSILSLYNNSLEGSLDSKYSDSVITYPPLTNTNSNEKSLRNRISNEEKPRKSFDDSIEAFFSSKTSRLNEISSNDADDGKKEKAKVIVPVPIPIPLEHHFVKESEKTQISTQNFPDSVTKKGTLVESDLTVMEEVSEMLDTNDAKYNYSQEHPPYTDNIVAPQKNNEELNAQLNVTTADPTVKSQIETSGIQTRPVDLIKPKIVDTPEDKYDISSYHEKHDEVDSYDDDQSTVKKSRTLPNEMPIPVQEKGQTKEHKVATPLSPVQDTQSSGKYSRTLHDEIPISVVKKEQTKENKIESPPSPVENDQSLEKTSRPLHNEMPMSVQGKEHELGESLNLISDLDAQAQQNLQQNRDLISSARGSMQDGRNFTIGHTIKPYDQNDYKRSNADPVMVSDYNDKMLKQNSADEFDELAFPEKLIKGITLSETDIKSTKQNEQLKETIKPQSPVGEVTPNRQNETLNPFSNTGRSMLDGRNFEQSGDDHIIASDYDFNDKMQDDNGLDEYKLTFSEKNSLDKGIIQLETETKASKQNEQMKGTIESQSPVDEVTRSRQNEPREHENIQENRDVISSTEGSMVDARNFVTGHTAKPHDQNDNISKQSADDHARSSDYDINDNEPPENRLDSKLPFPGNELLNKGITQSESERTSNIIPSAKAVNASSKDFSETDQYFMENMDVDDTEQDTKKPDLNKDYVNNESNDIFLQENSSSTDKKISQSNKNLLHNVISNDDDDNYDDTEPRKYNTIFESSKEDNDFSALTDPRHNGLVDRIPANNLQNLDTALHSSQMEQLNISNSNDGLENHKGLVPNFPDNEDNSDKDIANKMLDEINISEMLTNSSEFMEPITRSSLDEQKIENSKSIIESQLVKSERSSINYPNSLKYKFKTKSDMSRSNYSAQKKSPQVVSKSSLKKNSISLDMAFQSYVNEKKERIFKSLDSSVEAVRYPNDSVTVLQSPLSEDFEIRIPIDLENDMTIQIHRTKSPTQRVQILKQEPFVSEVSFPTLKGKHG